MERLARTEGLTDIQRDILATVREFVDKEIIPVASELEHKDEYPAQIVEGMKELGLFGLTIPEEYGGLGESLLTYALVVEQIARGWMSVSGIVNTHFIVAYMIGQHGTQEQKEYFLPRMATGDVRGAFSMSEPGMGSDVSAIRTRAERVKGDGEAGGDYVINGQKMWLTNGGTSNLVAVLCRTDEGHDAPHRNMTTFLIEKEPGFGANPDRVFPLLHSMRQQGLRLAIDDFGVGLSSLSRLRDIPAEILKIDRSFIMNLNRSPDGGAIVRAIIQLASNLRMTPHAEGIELEEQRQFLLANGCYQGQGFMFARAIPPAEVTRFALERMSASGVPLGDAARTRRAA